MALILQNIDKIVSLSDKEKEAILSKIEVKHYKAKTVLLNAGEICKHSYFVNSGILRSFNINDNIEVNEDAEVVLLSKENQEKLFQEIPKLERFFRILTENSLVANQERLMDNLSLSAEERFEKFCSKYPSLIQNVPQKQIASYIGVTPEFFSKMKARLLKKN